VPPTTEVGDSVRLARLSVEGVITRVDDFETLPSEAVMIAELLTEMETVEIVNFADVCPAGTVTDAGRVASTLLLVKATTTPPWPAPPLKPTTPDELFPLTTVAGLRLIETNAAGVIVSVADWDALPLPAVIVTAV